jgi:hypothetical protein
LRITSLRLLNVTGLAYKRVIIAPPAVNLGGAYLLTQNGLALVTQDDHYILVRGTALRTQDNRTLLTQAGNDIII